MRKNGPVKDASRKSVARDDPKEKRPSQPPRVLTGTAISGGVASGRVVLAQNESCGPTQCASGDFVDKNEEIARIKQALQLFLVVIDYTERLLKETLSGKHSDLFAMQKVLLEETAFRGRIIGAIRDQGLKASAAVRKVVEEYKKRLDVSGCDLVRDRASDLDDLRIGLIDALDRPNIFFKNGRWVRGKKGRLSRIAVAKNLTTRFVLEQNLEKVKGILAEYGGKTSHAAILCQALHLPCVSGLKDICSIVSDGLPVLVNGTAGRVTLSFGLTPYERLPTDSNSVPGKPGGSLP